MRKMRQSVALIGDVAARKPVTPDAATLTVIEWKIEIERALYLCIENGFTLREIAPGIQAPGYQFTAYLRSTLLEEMEEVGTIELTLGPEKAFS